MYFLSISQEGALHPLAAHPHVEGLVELGVSMDPEESLEIKGDLVAWSITTEVFQIFVYNWKTGESVWESGDFVRVVLLATFRILTFAPAIL